MKYFTKEWYLSCQKRDVNRQSIDAAEAAYREASAKESIPDDLRKQFRFHDGKVQEIYEDGGDLVIRIRSAWTPVTKIILAGAEVKKRDPEVTTGAYWIYQELYRAVFNTFEGGEYQKQLGYEIHVLFCDRKNTPAELVVRCRNIRFE